MTPHEHKQFSELFCKAEFGMRVFMELHVELEQIFTELYAISGDPVFRQCYETLHSTPRPLLNEPVMHS